jgi:hypothetical protein
MQRVSYKTLFLLLMLLASILVQQHTAKAVIRCDTVWLADDPNGPYEPGPERLGVGSMIRLDSDDPNNPVPDAPERA